MAVTKEEKDLLSGVAEQVRNIATGLSGNRRYVLERNAGVLEALVEGNRNEAKDEADPATPSKRATRKGRGNQQADSSDDDDQPGDKPD